MIAGQRCGGEFQLAVLSRAEASSLVLEEAVAGPAPFDSVFCSSGRGVAPRFLQTPPRDNALALW